MADAWGQTHITHYMVGKTLSLHSQIACGLWFKLFHICLQHILFAHGAFFLDKYGSLGILSSQGMECSHYQAKAVYFKNTRHRGRKVKSNAMHEMFNRFYRVSTERARRKT